jgi:EAL domain-containing protein (putative c-di-GMP-specific phosphodiesterase class I)
VLSTALPPPSEPSLDDVRCLARLRLALRDDGLSLVAQPIVNLTTGKVVGHELLVRLVGPHSTLIGPDYFLPAAERTGLIADLDRWVLERAVAVMAAGHRVNVNLSARSIGRCGVLPDLEDAVARTGADPTLLTVEITETAATEDIAAAASFCDHVTALGAQLALDDFGMGYGGLLYLKSLPVEMLKIDVEFVHDVVSNRCSRAVVEAVATIADDLGQVTVAEGVEDEATRGLLRELGVHCGQGFHLGRPVPVEELG